MWAVQFQIRTRFVQLGKVEEALMKRGAVSAVIGAISLLGGVMPSRSQTVDQCMANFNVNTSKSVTYLLIGTPNQQQVAASATCVDAEKMREAMYRMPGALTLQSYSTAGTLRAALANSRSALAGKRQELANAGSSFQVDTWLNGTLLGAGAGMTAASGTLCISGLWDGAGLAACGRAFVGLLTFIKSGRALQPSASDFVQKRNALINDIRAFEDQMKSLEEKLNDANVQQARGTYNSTFLAICKAVRDQCLN
jgi:uncharacterized protein GlcG (DUF336 family)